MKMFTVKGTVKDNYYGDYNNKESDVVQIVMAESAGEAIDKFEQYWHKQGKVGYEVWNVVALEAIE